MIKMPWNNATSPSVMLEITDACNIECDVCYRKRGGMVKSVAQVKQELKTAMRLRTLHTVSISGGEPTLHPQLCEIVKMIRSHGLLAMLLTNGVRIDEGYLRRLKSAGLDFILFHVDPWQKRPDLPENQKMSDVVARFRELTAMAGGYGIDASISMTLSDCDSETLRECSEFFFDSPDISFLFLTRGVDPETFFRKALSVKKNEKNRPFYDRGKDKIHKITKFYRERYGIEPFAFIPTSNGRSTVWISYFVPIIHKSSGRVLFQVRSNAVDVWLIKAARVLSGRYIQKAKQNSGITLLRVFLNSISTFRPLHFVRFAVSLLGPRTRLRHKMIVYDNGPYIAEDGDIVTCEYCPVAVVSKGRILKCCLASFRRAKGREHRAEGRWGEGETGRGGETACEPGKR